jgi:hypothetical protein
VTAESVAVAVAENSEIEFFRFTGNNYTYISVHTSNNVSREMMIKEFFVYFCTYNKINVYVFVHGGLLFICSFSICSWILGSVCFSLWSTFMVDHFSLSALYSISHLVLAPIEASFVVWHNVLLVLFRNHSMSTTLLENQISGVVENF